MIRPLSLTTALALVSLPAIAADEAISLRQKTESGIQGYTKADSQHARDGWMNSSLIVRTKGGATRVFRAGYAFIEAWGLTDHDTAVVIRSRNSHGPARWEKFDLASGKATDEYYHSKDPAKIPEWVKPFTE